MKRDRALCNAERLSVWIMMYVGVQYSVSVSDSVHDELVNELLR